MNIGQDVDQGGWLRCSSYVLRYVISRHAKSMEVLVAIGLMLSDCRYASSISRTRSLSSNKMNGGGEFLKGGGTKVSRASAVVDGLALFVRTSADELDAQCYLNGRHFRSLSLECLINLIYSILSRISLRLRLASALLRRIRQCTLYIRESHLYYSRISRLYLRVTSMGT